MSADWDWEDITGQEGVNPSPHPPAPLPRLIVVKVQPGQDVQVDWDGDFAYWELIAALKRAIDKMEDQRIEDEINEQLRDDEDEEED